MIALSAADNAGTLAHGIHYALVAGGLVGLTLLLAPHTITLRRRPLSPHDGHERRIRQLRDDLLSQRLATATTATAGPTAELTASSPRLSGRHLSAVGPEQGPRTARPGGASYVLLPVGVVSSAAAAGVHAAVCPDHFRERTLLGLFFAAAALAQLAWAGLALRGSSRTLLVVGLVGSLGLLTLWMATRTTGLPWGLVHGTEPVGPWDLAAGAWELVVAGTCFQLLREGRHSTRLGGWSAWHPAARGFFAASVVLLGILSISGAGA